MHILAVQPHIVAYIMCDVHYKTVRSGRRRRRKVIRKIAIRLVLVFTQDKYRLMR